ncbi:hypothetical protein Tco_0098454 [Tanacetum coccineum]
MFVTQCVESSDAYVSSAGYPLLLLSWLPIASPKKQLPDSYIRPPRFRETIEEITDDPVSIAPVEHRSKKMLLLTWHDSMEPTEEPVCESDIPRSLAEHDSNTPFEDSFLPVSEDPYIGRSQEPIMEEVRTHEPIVEDVILEDYVSSAELGKGQFFYDDEGIDIAYETEYDVHSSEDVGTYDDDDEDFLVDEGNKIVEPDVDVHLFGISMDVPFDNISVNNLVLDDVLEGENVNVINADGFDNDLGNDDETSNYRRRRLAKLSREIECVINASGQWKYSFYTRQKFTTAKEAKDILYLHIIESRRNLKLYKNDSIGPTGPNYGMEAGPSGSSDPSQVLVAVALDSNNGIYTLAYAFIEAESRAKSNLFLNNICEVFNGKIVKGRDKPVIKLLEYTREYCMEEIRNKYQVSSALGDQCVVDVVTMTCSCRKKELHGFLVSMLLQLVGIWLTRSVGGSGVGAVIGLFAANGQGAVGGPGGAGVGVGSQGQVLAAVALDSNNGIYTLAYAFVEAEKHIYFLRHIHENMKKGWCGQAYKDLLQRSASTTSVKEFEKCRAKSNLFLNNICEVFNGKIVKGRDKPVIKLLEYTREYCMKKIVNVQSVIDKCTSPLTPTATRIMESIKKEAHFIKVQWNEGKKYQVSGALDQYWEKSTCPTRLFPPKHHVHVGRPKNRRKRSKHEDEPFVKDGKLSKKERTITCQSCGNIRHNKATCKGQGRKATTGGNNAKASGSASRQAQQTELAVGQDGSGGSGVGAVITLSVANGQGAAGGPGGAGVGVGS